MLAHLGTMLGFVELSWAYVGFCWVVFGPSWDYVASPGLLWAYVHFILGLCWTILGLCWVLLGRLGPMLAHLGTMLGLPGFYVGPSWPCVGLSWGYLGTMLGFFGSSWAYVGPSWDYVGRSWVLCWAILALCWPILGLCCAVLGLCRTTSKCKSCMTTCFQASFSRYLQCFLHVARFRSASLETTKRTKFGSRAGKTHFLQQLDSLNFFFTERFPSSVPPPQGLPRNNKKDKIWLSCR